MRKLHIGEKRESSSLIRRLMKKEILILEKYYETKLVLNNSKEILKNQRLIELSEKNECLVLYQ